VGSHGLGGIERFVMGSVSQKVLRHARCSVLVVKQAVREPGTREAGRRPPGRRRRGSGAIGDVDCLAPDGGASPSAAPAGDRDALLPRPPPAGSSPAPRSVAAAGLVSAALCSPAVAS
jgi:hypothetical protein